MERNELRKAFRIQRRGVGYKVDPFDHGIPESDRTAEGVEKRQAAEDGGIATHVQPGGELGYIRENIAVSEGNAFWFAGGAGG